MKTLLSSEVDWHPTYAEGDRSLSGGTSLSEDEYW